MEISPITRAIKPRCVAKNTPIARKHKANKSSRCSGKAMYKIDGKNLCPIHAGKYCLENELQKQTSSQED